MVVATGGDEVAAEVALSEDAPAGLALLRGAGGDGLTQAMVRRAAEPVAA